MARPGKKRGAQPRPSGGGGSKPVAWLVAGLLAGWLTAFGVYLLKILPTALEIEQRNAACKEPTTGDKPVAAGKAGEQPLRFDFYTLLPQQEVVAPAPATRTTTAVPPKPAAAATSTPAADATEKPRRYLLQAGSFRTRAEADRRRGELTLSGYDVQVQEGTTGNGERWFRVMVGPYGNEVDMQKAREELAAARIDTLPIRQK
jgi:cell division protein FtsN